MKQFKYKGNIYKYSVIRKNIKNIYITIKNGAVIVIAPKIVEDKQIEELVNKKVKWICKKLEDEELKKERKDLYTKEEFIEIVSELTSQLVKETGLRPNKIRIKAIKYAWGSCSENKNITINLKLIQYSKEAIKYVILHELCHLKYMNHSKDFWNLVYMYMPQYKEVRKKLK